MTSTIDCKSICEDVIHLRFIEDLPHCSFDNEFNERKYLVDNAHEQKIDQLNNYFSQFISTKNLLFAILASKLKFFATTFQHGTIVSRTTEARKPCLGTSCVTCTT